MDLEQMLHDILAMKIRNLIIKEAKNGGYDLSNPQRKSWRMIREIQGFLQNPELTDFEIVEEIVDLFIHYGIDTGDCHDFG